MTMLKAGFLVVAILLSAVAIFIGIVLLTTSLKLGNITLSYTLNNETMTETVLRANDAARFWNLLIFIGVMPLVVGALSLWYSLRILRRPPAQ